MTESVVRKEPYVICASDEYSRHALCNDKTATKLFVEMTMYKFILKESNQSAVTCNSAMNEILYLHDMQNLG